MDEILTVIYAAEVKFGTDLFGSNLWINVDDCWPSLT